MARQGIGNEKVYVIVTHGTISLRVTAVQASHDIGMQQRRFDLQIFVSYSLNRFTSMS